MYRLAVLGRVLINASDVRFRGVIGHGQAVLNRSKMTHFGPANVC